MSTTTGAVERLVDRGRRAPDGVLQQRRRRRPTATSGSPTRAPSTRSSKWKADFVEDTRTGRLLCRRRRTARVEVHLDGLAFANGVALAAGRVVRLRRRDRRAAPSYGCWLTGERAGTRDLLVDGPARLPRQHRPRQRRPDLGDHRLAGRPGSWSGSAAGPPLACARPPTRIPQALQPKPKRTVRVQAYDDAGRLVHDVDADAGRATTWSPGSGSTRAGLAGQPRRSPAVARAPAVTV